MDIPIERAAVTRRRMLKTAGAMIALSQVRTVRPEGAAAQADEQVQPAMRRPSEPTSVSSAALDSATGFPLPALEIIALNRMAFGPRAGDLSDFRKLGDTDEERLQAYVNQQINPASIDDGDCEAILAAQSFTTLGKSLAQLWQDHAIKDGISYSERLLPATEIEKAAFLKAAYSKRQLQEVLADFWHNHFNIYAWDRWEASTFVHYDRDVIRANLFGNFFTMLEAVSHSPAMLYYLDNNSNSGGNPNENYARELFELHTMGAENYFGVHALEIGPDGSFIHPAPSDENGRPLLYVDADVYGATTCFTGWQVDRETGQFYFNAPDHFPYQKFVLGQAIPDSQGIKDGYDVLHLLAEHTGTARYISRKLCRRLVSDNPPESLVERAAAVFLAERDAPDQLKSVVKAILLSEEFRTTWGEKIKRPFEYTVSIVRAAGIDFVPHDHFFWRYDEMGQPLFGWRPPNGYPDLKEDWSSTMPMLQRWRVCNWLLEWKYADGPKKDEYRVLFNHPAKYSKAVEIVDYWSRKLLGRTLPAQERDSVIDFMAHGRAIDGDLPSDQIEERLRYMIGLIFMSPSFQVR